MTEELVAHDRELRLASQAPLGLAAYPTFQHVAVLLDGSSLAERSLPYLLAVAHAGASTLTLLQVQQQPQAHSGARGVDAVEWEMGRAEGQSYLAGIAARLQARGVASRIELAQGATEEQIERFAAGGDVDLMVMTSHGEGGVSPHWARGCTAQKVIGTGTTSLLVVPAQAAAQEGIATLRRILLPLDCSQRAECILPIATALARSHDAELLLTHVVCEPEMPRRMGPSRADLELAETIVEGNTRAASHYLRELQGRLISDSNRVTVRLCSGTDRAQAVRELAHREAIDLIMLAAHGGTGDAQQRYGALATALLQHADVPVLVLQDLGRLG